MALDKRFFVNGALVSEESATPFLEGRIVNGNLVSESEGPLLPTTPKAKAAEGLEETPEKLAPNALEALMASRRFLAISLPDCPQCEELAAALALRGVPASVFVKWNKASPEYAAQKAAVAAHAGQVFSFPQVFVDGVYQGGYLETLSKLEVGTYDELFLEEFDAKPMTVQKWVNSQPMLIFSLPSCPQCDELRSLLQARGLPVEKVFMKWDKAMPQYQSLKAQLVQLISLTSFTFPQTFVRSEYQGSFPEVADKLAQGRFDDFFSEAFGVAPPAPPAPVAPAAVDIAFDEDF